MTNDKRMDYLVWRNARKRFGRDLQDLDKEQAKLVLEQAQRELHVIRTALAVPEAAGIRVEDGAAEEIAEAMIPDQQERTALLGGLQRAGLSWEGLLLAIGDELHAGLVLERIAEDSVCVDEDQVRSFFERHRSRMVRPEQRAARHVLITINDKFAENTRDEAKRRLDSVAQACADGADFSELARRHSECPSAMEGGSLGEVRRGQLYPALETALFSLAEGEIGEVESTLGFHLLRCDTITPEAPIAYEEAADSIRGRLTQNARDRFLREWLAAQEKTYLSRGS